MDSEALLRRLARQDLPRVPPEGPCLTEETLAALRADRLDDDARQAAEAHLAACELCLDHLLSGADARPQLAPGTVSRILRETAPPRRRSAAWLTGLVAAAALAGALAIVTLPSPPQAPSGAWTLELAGGLATQRGAPTAPGLAAWGPDSAVIFRVTPEEGAPARPVIAVPYVGRPGQALRRVPAATGGERDPHTGQIELRLDAAGLFDEGAGRYEVGILLLGDPADAPAAVSASADSVPEGARLLTAGAEYTP